MDVLEFPFQNVNFVTIAHAQMVFALNRVLVHFTVKNIKMLRRELKWEWHLAARQSYISDEAEVGSNWVEHSALIIYMVWIILLDKHDNLYSQRTVNKCYHILPPYFICPFVIFYQITTFVLETLIIVKFNHIHEDVSVW